MATTQQEEQQQLQHPRIEQVLVAAERDLDNAEYKFGLLLNPFRALVVRPGLQVANLVLPLVAAHVPLVDDLTSTVLQFSVDACKNVYHATHPEQDDAVYQIHHQTEKEFERNKNLDAEKIMAELEAKSTARQVKGFLVSAAIEFLGDPISNTGKWLDFSKQLVEYLFKAGIADELRVAMTSPYWIKEMNILGRIQYVQDNVDIRRHETALPKNGSSLSSRRPVAQVAKLMRYCCAAYGQEMMESYDILAQKKHSDERSEKYKNMVGSESLKQQVCDYVGIPTSYITYFCMGHGGSMELLRHYISVDHELQSVVFVIRGTYSISGWHIDFQGQAVPFMNGQAHKGISEMAKNLVVKSRSEIISALRLYSDYKLIITGQSLGGGVSPLVNMLCHADPVIGKHGAGIECHAFAGPPVYTHVSSNPEVQQQHQQPTATVQRAMTNCIHYVHDTDIVPYLGVHSVRRLNAQILALDKVVSHAPFLDPILMAAGRKLPTPEMVSAVLYGDPTTKTTSNGANGHANGTNGSSLKPISGAPVLYTPCKEVVWFCQDPSSKQVNYTVCNPVAFIERGILLSITGTADHVPPKYCQVLNYAEEHGWEENSVV